VRIKQTTKERSMRIARMILLALILLTAIHGYAAITVHAGELRVPVIIEGKKELPLRILVKSFANIYQEKSTSSSIIKENLPAFQPFYVYTRPTDQELKAGTGWYEIGSDNRGTVIGWMQQEDVFEWKQTLCLSYTHPMGRMPVAMFDNPDFARKLATMEPTARKARLKELLEEINSGNLSQEFPITSIEPKQAVDINKEFYLLPIIDYESIELDNREGRLVQLAAVTNAVGDARVKSDIRINTEYRQQAIQEVASISREKAKGIKADVVWVVDTTVSMKPFIDKALEVMRKISAKLGDSKETEDAMRFGVWGYRDSVEDMPGIEYTTFNYTPKLLPVEQFIEQLSKVDVTETDSMDYPEDMFSGVADAISNTSWTPGAARFIVLVGDAPSHQAGHKWNLSGKEEQSLRSLIADRRIYLAAIHLKNPRAVKFHELTEQQMRTLSQNSGMDKSAYWDIDSSDLNEYARVTEALSSTFGGTLTIIRQLAMVSSNPEEKIAEMLGESNGDRQLTEGSSHLTEMLAKMKAASDGNIEPVKPSSLSQPDPGSEPAKQPKIEGELADLEDININEIQQQTGGELASLKNISDPTTTNEAGGELADIESQSDDSTGHGSKDVVRTTNQAGVKQQENTKLDLDLDSITKSSSQGEDLAAQMVKAAVVQWIGSQSRTKAPRDIIAWAIDKDLGDPSIQAMEVRLLINKQQLDSLYNVLKSVLAAGQQGQIGGGEFFDSLQATAAVLVRNPELIGKAKTMAGTQLVPEFLDGLPYHSQLMDMNNELWASWSVDQQDEFLNNLEANLETYRTIHDSPEGWIQLNPGDDSDEFVYPLSLDTLP
jgi:hypothetical protein